MENFQHSQTIAASPAAVYAAFATIDGLRGWWTRDCEGAAEVGGLIYFRFGDSYNDMRVDLLDPGREVRWQCTGAHTAADALTRKGEWVGTRPVFRISDAGRGRTRLDFEHIGLLPSLECYAMCERGWKHFMGSVRDYLETGEGRPYGPASDPCHASTEGRVAA